MDEQEKNLGQPEKSEPGRSNKKPGGENLFLRFSNLIKKTQANVLGFASRMLQKKKTEEANPSVFPPQPIDDLSAGGDPDYQMTPQVLFQRYKKYIAILAAILVLGLIVRSCGAKKKSLESLKEIVSQEKQAAEEGVIPVKGFKVGRFNFEDSLNALGTVKGAMEFKLSFEVPGTISSINYKEGERYEEGALLVSLKQDDILLRLKRAQAEMNKYQAQASIADQKVKDHEKLFAMGAITKSALDNVKLELDSAKYETEAARLEVKAAEAMLEKSNLYAPSAGMIGELSVEEGEAITANTLLGTHINTEFVYAEFGVVERDVNKIALGQKARVFIDAYPDKTFEGVIENVSPVVAGTSRTATAKVRIENPERLLLPGMFARIRILLYSKKNTLVVPTDAIQGGQGEQFVYVIRMNKPLIPEGAEKSGMKIDKNSPMKQISPEGEEQLESQLADKKAKKSKKSEAKKDQTTEGKASGKTPETVEKRAITVGYTRPDYSQIDAGLSEGEVIAASGFERLEDGKKVRLLETQEAEV